MTIAQLAPDHLLMTSSKRYNGKIENVAKCSCEFEFAWSTRDYDHLRHVLDIVWQDAYIKGLKDMKQFATRGVLNNAYSSPYKDQP